MKSIKGKYFIIIGTVLLMAALSLILYNVIEDKKSGEYAENVLAELKIDISEAAESSEAALSEEIQPVTENIFAKYDDAAEETAEAEEAIPESLEINGESYIGIIAIPSLGIELPVMAQWSYPNLKHAPCRYTGSPESESLIIAAHNYNSHFGRISELYSGDEIFFTDINGRIYRYEVAVTETINGKDVESMMKDVDDRWELTLFTCTLSGQSRVSVRAAAVDESTE